MNTSSPYANPSLECDLIMKGGITSGIVYPLAVAELANTYKFVNIGGTSAGAIAAALTSAAEFARQSGRPEAFDELAKLPLWLGERNAGGRSNLFRLFQPSPRTGRIFSVLTSSLNRESLPGRIRGVAAAAAFHYPLAGALGAAFGILIIIAGIGQVPGQRILGAFTLVLGCVIGVVGWFIGTIAGIVLNAIKVLPENGFGLCSGLTTKGTRVALTEWLADLIDSVAGMSGEKPLTFGDLRANAINLEMLTSNLSQGRPYRLPFLHRSVATEPPTDDHTFYFNPREWGSLFPKRIVDWLLAHPGPSNDLSLKAAITRAGVVPLPRTDDLPVVVCARLSLSFPFLLSAVPMWAFDFSRLNNQTDSTGERPNAAPARCWFSDGGITSDFPVHLFDSPFPRRPTFALDLGPFHPDHPQDLQDECKNIYRPHFNSAGQAEHWTLFPAKGVRALGTLISSMLETTRNWHDNMQIHVPGYRDRVVVIHLNEKEGGLNLDMLPSTITALALRGQCAGRELRTAFGAVEQDFGQPCAWDNHRWIRYRTTMLLLEDVVRQLSEAYPYSDGAHATYKQLIRSMGETPPYPWTEPAQEEFSRRVTERLAGIWEGWNHHSETFLGNHPRPVPELRIVPRI